MYLIFCSFPESLHTGKEMLRSCFKKQTENTCPRHKSGFRMINRANVETKGLFNEEFLTPKEIDYHQLADRLPEDALLLDGKGRAQAANRAASSLLNFNEKKLGRQIKIPGCSPETVARLLDGSLDFYELPPKPRDVDPIHLEIFARNVKGRDRYLVAKAMPVNERSEPIELFLHHLKTLMTNYPLAHQKMLDEAKKRGEKLPPESAALAYLGMIKFYDYYLDEQLHYPLRATPYRTEIPNVSTKAVDPHEILFDLYPSGLAVVRKDGKIMESNPVFRYLTGGNPKAKNRLKSPQPFPGETAVKPHLQIGLAEKESYRFHRKFLLAEIDPVAHRHLEFAVLPPEKAYEHFIITTEDVTAQTHRMDLIRRNSVEKVSNAWAPTQAIMAEIEKEPNSYSPFVKEIISDSDSNFYTIWQLCENNMFYPIPAGKRERVKLKEFLEKFKIDIRPLIQDGTVELNIDGTPEINTVVKDLHWSLSAIIVNALHAKADKITVKCSYTKDGKRVLISITDNGVGIPADQINKLLDGHYPSTNPRGEGKGVKQVVRTVRNHGGHLHITSWQKDASHESSGTTFKFSLPVNPTSPYDSVSPNG